MAPAVGASPAAAAPGPLSVAEQRRGEELLAKLRRFDPELRREQYLHVNRGAYAAADVSRPQGACWDIAGLEEDLRLTQELYAPESLEVVLQPMRVEMQQLVDGLPRINGTVVIVPGVLALGDASSASDIEGLQRLGVRRIVNCSPQTVRTGQDFYRMRLPGTEYVELWQDDMSDFCVLQDLDQVWDFAMGGGSCLVHCERGVNRSAALVVAMHMKLQSKAEQRQRAPEDILMASWRFVAERRPRAVTNQSFQRQLLLFARLGLRWFPSVSATWRTPQEHLMARFRVFAERVGREVVRGWERIPPERQQRAVVYIRDGTVRAETRMNGTFDLSSAEAQRRAESRIRSYAQSSFERLTREEGPPGVAPAAAA